MSRTLRRTLIGLASILLVMNLWMWDGRLPFVGYQENNAHLMILQLIHVVLIVSELLILMLLGRKETRAIGRIKQIIQMPAEKEV